MKPLLITLMLILSLMGCSSKQKIEMPQSTLAAPTSPPMSIGQ